MSSLRVISGKARGKKLRSVPGDITRPITDRVKEALFNIIGADIVSSKLLDLFAGTGSVGIEALSRGAKYVLFLDKNRNAINTIRQNIESTGVSQHSEVVKTDAFVYIKKPPDNSFDYIYVAPPQYKDLWKKAIKLLDERKGWLDSDGWVIVQIHPKEYQEIELKHLFEFDQRDYGSTRLVFYRKNQ